LRKDLLLAGHGDVSAALRRLIRAGFLVILPGSGQSELDLESMLEQQGFLQQELALTEALLAALDARGITHSDSEVGAWSGELASSQLESTQSLELNLLHLAASLNRDVLRLNKSGAPNRRSLTRFIAGITRPASQDPNDPWVDLNDSRHANYTAFLLALVRELGLTRVIEDRGLVGDFEGARAYFTSPDERRGQKLLQIAQNLKGWSEGVGPSIEDGREPDEILEVQLSQTRDNGSALIGARGYILSVLRRAHLNGWTPLSAVVELCAQLDRDYLRRVFARTDHALEIDLYVRAFIVDVLFWLGMVELGEDTDGVELMRLTPTGLHLLGVAKVEEHDDEPSRGCLFVQPNFEAMVFLDAAPMHVLYSLYQVGERVNLADRVATFKLTAESVQRGYSMGLDAASAIELLENHSHAPLADLIEFQLKDWERVWGRVTLWASGMLLRHDDPDRLDTILGQVRHALRDEPLQTERLAAGAVFLHTPAQEEVLRQLERYKGLRIDYLGEIPPCLEAIDGMTFAYEPMLSDIETIGIIKKISSEKSQECSPRRRVVELDPDLLSEFWPEQTFSHLLTFLRERVRGGLPSEQLLQLKARLLTAPAATLLHAVVVVTLDTVEDAGLFATTEYAAEFDITPLGDRSFAISQEHLDPLIEALEHLGIEIDHL
ncbi:unnamed protein product, partial [Laminaria digitata]